MPSSILFPQSGGIALVSGDIISGSIVPPFGGIQLLLDDGAPGPVYVGYRRKNVPDLAAWSGYLSGAVTITSGGVLSSGGLGDGMKLAVGKDYFVPKVVLSSGILDIRVAVPAASSGGRMFWEFI